MKLSLYYVVLHLYNRDDDSFTFFSLVINGNSIARREGEILLKFKVNQYVLLNEDLRSRVLKKDEKYFDGPHLIARIMDDRFYLVEINNRIYWLREYDVVEYTTFDRYKDILKTLREEKEIEI